MTIGRKLTLAFGAMLGAALLLALASLTTIRSLQSELDQTANRTARRQYLAGEIGSSTSEMAGLERGIVLSTMLQQAERSESCKRQFRAAVERLDRAVAEFRGIADSPEMTGTVETIAAKSADVRRAHEEFLGFMSGQQMDAALKAFEDRVLPKVTDISATGAGLVEQQKQALAKMSTEAAVSSFRSILVMVLLLAVLLVISAAVMATVRKATIHLRHLGEEMAQGASEVAGVAAQVSEASQSLARGASEQSNLLERTAASAEQITTITRNNADNSRSVAELMQQSADVVGKANVTLDQMVGSMKSINASSDRISRIIKVIDEIAFQTNILALNAAVEAARAGEAGLGFAVVADEVRNLAQRCAQAAKDTSDLIEESISRSADGNTKLDQVASAIRALTENSDRIKKLVDEVNERSQEQARGIEEISRAVVKIEKVTHTTAASAGQSASAGTEMSSQAHNLKRLVNEFWSMVGGERSLAATEV